MTSLLKTALVLSGQAIATITANYATSALIDMYVAPDLKNCSSDEECAKKLKNFETAKSAAKIGINVLEAAALGKVSHTILTKTDKVKVSNNSNNNSVVKEDDTTNNYSEESTENVETDRGFLVGKNFLIHNI